MARLRSLGIASVLMILVFIFVAGASAQEATRAEIRGTVMDSGGGVLPGVTVTAVHVDTGETRTAVSGETGLYRLPALALGTHTISVQLDGFNTIRREGVTLRIGQALTMDFSMEVGGLQETVTVVGGAAVIETTKAEVAGILAPEQIANLPLMGRHWMELGILMPGVTSTSVGPRGIASGRGSDGDQAIYIDGTDSRNECCSRNSGSHSQDAIAEFKVVTNNYAAEFGRSTSFVLTAVTKSGTNALHGSGFYFVRDEKLDSADFFTRKVEPYSFNQWGGTAGGPIKKDRLFFFGSYERQFEGGTAFSTTGYEQLDKVAVDATNTQNYVLAKVDWLLPAAQRLTAKYYYWDSADHNGRNSTVRVGGTNTFTNVSDESLLNYGVVVNHNSSSTHWVNEAYFGYIWTDWALHPKEGIPISGGFRPSQQPLPYLVTPRFNLGGQFNFPQEGFEYKFEVKDSFSRFFDWHGGHDLKVGGGVIIGQNDLAYFRLARGQVNFSAAPSDPFNFNSYPEPTRFQIKLFRPGASVACPDDYKFEFTRLELERLGSCAPYTVVPLQVYSGFIQDSWRMNQNVTLNAGLRYDLEAGQLLPDYLEKYKPELNPQIPHPTRSDRNNLAPRFSFSYRPRGSEKTVIRAGAGVFFGATILNRGLDKLISDGWYTATADQRFPTRQPCFQGHTLEEALTQNVQLLLPGCGTLSFDQLYASGAKGINALDPNVDENRGIHVGMGLGRELTGDLGLEVDYVYQRQGPYVVTTDTNLFFDPATGGPRNPALGRPDPRFTEILTTSDFAKFRQHALEVRVNKRYRQGYQFQTSYAFTYARDTTGGRNNGPDNPFNRNDWGPPSGSQVHRLTVNGSVDLPWNFQLSGILLTYSGIAYADLVSGDGWNLGRSTSQAIRQPDGTVVVLERNSNRGRPYAKLDLRVTKWFALGGPDRKVGLIAEAFNVLNHKNYGGYGTVRGTPNYQQPVRVLASAFTSRQAQLGVRVNF